MVEFGAGGNITHPAEGADEGANPVPSMPGTGAAAATVPSTAAANRRKRKAKGWFCPVCRQRKFIFLENNLNETNILTSCLAYTSMLRITTNPPPQPENKDGEGSGTEDEGSPIPTTNTPAAEVTEFRGLLGSALRPGFLRGLSLSRNTAVTNPDVESRAGLGRVGA
jgi:hypothetical protein